MSVQASTHGYTPLDDKELRTIDRIMKTHAPELRVQVVSQLREQEQNLQLRNAHIHAIKRSASEILSDLVDSIEELEDTARTWEAHECGDD